jgi:hypothetical protein
MCGDGAGGERAAATEWPFAGELMHFGFSMPCDVRGDDGASPSRRGSMPRENAVTHRQPRG